MLTDITYKGKKYKGLVSASRNGWFHAIDRTNGKLIYAEKFATATSVSGFDANGKAITDPAMRPTVDKKCSPAPASKDPKVRNIPLGGHLYVFSL